jgi:hypothetical protein
VKARRIAGKSPDADQAEAAPRQATIKTGATLSGEVT